MGDVIRLFQEKQIPELDALADYELLSQVYKHPNFPYIDPPQTIVPFRKHTFFSCVPSKVFSGVLHVYWKLLLKLALNRF